MSLYHDAKKSHFLFNWNFSIFHCPEKIACFQFKRLPCFPGVKITSGLVSETTVRMKLTVWIAWTLPLMIELFQFSHANTILSLNFHRWEEDDRHYLCSRPNVMQLEWNHRDSSGKTHFTEILVRRPTGQSLWMIAQILNFKLIVLF